MPMVKGCLVVIWKMDEDWMMWLQLHYQCSRAINTFLSCKYYANPLALTMPVKQMQMVLFMEEHKLLTIVWSVPMFNGQEIQYFDLKTQFLSSHFKVMQFSSEENLWKIISTDHEIYECVFTNKIKILFRSCCKSNFNLFKSFLNSNYI